MKTTHKPTKKIAQKVVELVNHGLVSGLGTQEPGKMCIEAAVCFAFGLPHSDNPPCVGSTVRSFKITLNDCGWSSDMARAEGMKKLAVAQLGSDTLDQMKFGKLCYLRGVQTLMPQIFRKAALELSGKDKAVFLALADKCEAVETLEQVERAAKDAAAAASASAYAFASATATAAAAAAAFASAAFASAYAYASAYAFASASAYASAAAAASASAYAFASASAYASAAAAASAYAYASASARRWFRDNMGDEFLIATAEMGLGVLTEMKSPGCKWLDLCDVKTGDKIALGE